MKTRRSITQIRAEILLNTIQETNPTTVMYDTNLSWQPLCKQLEFLESKGLITKRSTLNDRRRDKRTTEVLQTTPAGLAAVRDLNKYLRMFGLPLVKS